MDSAFNIESKKKLRQILEKAFNKDESSKKNSSDISFHVLDWIEDLEELYRLFLSIDKKTDDEIRDVIEDFLVHAPPHINAARFLAGLGKVEDVFNLGVIEK